MVVAAINFWPAAPPADLSAEERALYEAQIEDFVSRSRAASDSVAAAKTERQEAYAQRQAEWERKRAGWARDKAARAARRALWAEGRSPRRATSTTATAIDYGVAMPAPGSLDANAVDSATLLRLGVPVAIAGRWLKYRRSGGRFRRPADIGKLYGLSDTTAARLQAYFSTPTPVADTGVGQSFGTSSVSTERDNSTAPTALLDINTATAEQLEALRGIGAYTAGKIVEYRGWLGGYVSLDQLTEARGVRAENLEAILPRLTVGPAAPTERIRVNAATTYEEWRHPYLAWKKAKVLLAFREQHGPYAAAADLLRAKVMTPEEVARLSPYLDFET